MIKLYISEKLEIMMIQAYMLEWLDMETALINKKIVVGMNL